MLLYIIKLEVFVEKVTKVCRETKGGNYWNEIYLYGILSISTSCRDDKNANFLPLWERHFPYSGSYLLI